MSSTALVPPPSSFAALLRHSKFASYDASIGQIYTTYGGHAHRGDWGLKRALPLRGRGPKATLQAIDTPYQQTEWTLARGDAAWLRKWQEVGGSVQSEGTSSWRHRTQGFRIQRTSAWHSDSDFGGDAVEEVLEIQSREDEPVQRKRFTTASRVEDFAKAGAVPDIHGMSYKQFAGFVKRVRGLRSEFSEYLEKARAEKVVKSGSPSNYPKPSDPNERRFVENFHHLRFLAMKEDESLLHTTRLRSLPHPIAGLSYARVPPLQRALTENALPGRRLTDSRSRGGQDPSMNVAVAGWIGKEALRGVKDLVTTDFGSRDGETPRKDRVAGVAKFKPLEVHLLNAPRTVGRTPEGLSKMALRAEFVSWDEAPLEGENPHTPGSREYVAHNDATIVITRQHSMTNPPDSKPKFKSKKTPHQASADLLQQLHQRLSKIGVDPNEPL